MKQTASPQELIILILLLFFLCFERFFSSKKSSKQALAEYYKITRPTLTKWIEHFQTAYTLDEWKKKRALSEWDVSIIKAAFGEDAEMVLNKGQLASATESDYKTLAGMVKLNVNKLGFTLRAWESCNTFPPAVSGRVIRIM